MGFNCFIKDMNLSFEVVKTEEEFINELLPRLFKQKQGKGQRNVEIVKMRYGLGGYEKHIYKNIAEKYNISQERVRTVILSAYRKLRSPYIQAWLAGITGDSVITQLSNLIKEQQRNIKVSYE
jgi:RNA polymerase primary sigma factor